MAANINYNDLSQSIRDYRSGVSNKLSDINSSISELYTIINNMQNSYTTSYAPATSGTGSSSFIDDTTLLNILKRLEYLEQRLGGYELTPVDGSTIDFFVNLLPNNNSINYIFDTYPDIFPSSIQGDILKIFLTSNYYNIYSDAEYNGLKTFEDFIQYVINVDYGALSLLYNLDWYHPQQNWNNIQYAENSIDSLALTQNSTVFTGIKGLTMQPITPITKSVVSCTTNDEVDEVVNAEDDTKITHWEVHYQPNVFKQKNGEYIEKYTSGLSENYATNKIYKPSSTSTTTGCDFHCNVAYAYSNPITIDNTKAVGKDPDALSSGNYYRMVIPNGESAGLRYLGYYPRQLTAEAFKSIFKAQAGQADGYHFTSYSNYQNSLNQDYSVFTYDTELGKYVIWPEYKYTFVPTKFIQPTRFAGAGGQEIWQDEVFYNGSFTGLKYMTGHQWEYLENLVNSYLVACGNCPLSVDEYIIVKIYSIISEQLNSEVKTNTGSTSKTITYDGDQELIIDDDGKISCKSNRRESLQLSADTYTKLENSWSTNYNNKSWTAVYYNETNTNKNLVARLRKFAEEYIKNSNKAGIDSADSYSFESLLDIFKAARAMASCYVRWQEVIPDSVIKWESLSTAWGAHAPYNISLIDSTDKDWSSGGDIRSNVINNPFALISIKENYPGIYADVSISSTADPSSVTKFRWKLQDMYRPIFIDYEFGPYLEDIKYSEDNNQGRIQQFTMPGGSWQFWLHGSPQKKTLFYCNSYPLSIFSNSDFIYEFGSMKSANYIPYDGVKFLVYAGDEANLKALFGNNFITNAKKMEGSNDKVIIIDNMHDLKIQDSYSGDPRKIRISCCALGPVKSIEWPENNLPTGAVSSSWENHDGWKVVTYPNIWGRFYGCSNTGDLPAGNPWKWSTANNNRDGQSLIDGLILNGFGMWDYFTDNDCGIENYGQWATSTNTEAPALKKIVSSGSGDTMKYIEWVELYVYPTSNDRRYEISTTANSGLKDITPNNTASTSVPLIAPETND